MSEAEEPWRDRDTLHELYHGKKMTKGEIADKYDLTQTGIGHWMDKLGIESRSMAESARLRRITEPPRMYTHSDTGYEHVRVRTAGEDSTLLIHRLLAVAEYGFEAVKDNHIHHKKGIPWANWHDNIELLTPAEHSTHHQVENGVNADLPWRDEETLRELYKERELSIEDIAEVLECEYETVRRWMIHYDIDRRNPGRGNVR